MNRQTILIIIVAVVLVHVGLFYLAAQTRELPKARFIPPPNFGAIEQTYTDTTTGEKVTYREIRVSTKLADPETVKRMEEQIAKARATPTP